MSVVTHPLQYISGKDLHFADDIDGLAREEEELAKLVECLNKTYTAPWHGVQCWKDQLMTNNTSGINKEIKVPGLSYIWPGFQAWDIPQDNTDNSSIDKV